MKKFVISLKQNNQNNNIKKQQDINYFKIPAYDIPGFSLLVYFAESTSFITENIEKGNVLVHWLVLI